MTVVTRFAPSPTGYLHIGSARTALFSWLYARRHNGKFLLRVEDTDRARSTDAATQAIIDGMTWLGMQWDDEVVHQFSRAKRHAEVAHELLEKGHAYYCYTSQAELAVLREAGKPYDRKWRDKSPQDAPADIKPVIRIKAPLTGQITLKDKVLGDTSVDCTQLDDMVLLRSDGTPTYMLAVVVDDHDMGVTHVIRGSDHFTNTFRQQMIYDAMGWAIPEFAHIPLIHGADGAKLSKRHGALGVDAYREMGYLPEALRNYLLRLGWAHGDDEIISTEQAIEWFNLEGIGKSPARFDFTKLENLNGHYIRESDNARLVDLIVPFIEKKYGQPVADKGRLLQGMNGLKQRAKTIVELADAAAFYVLPRPIVFNDRAKAILNDDGKVLLRALLPLYEALTDWNEAALQDIAKQYGEQHIVKLGNVAQPLRAALCGSNISPSVFEVMFVLGKQETLARIKDAC